LIHAGVGEVGVDSFAPGAERKPVLCVLAPRHLLHPELAVSGAKHGAAEQEQQRNLSGVEAREVASRADLEVIAELDRQIDIDTAGEARDHGRHGGELHGLERVRPALRIAEKVIQALRLGRQYSGAWLARS